MILSVSVFADTKSQVQSLDKIAAIVNSDVITESQLQQQIRIIKQQNQGNSALPSDKEIRQKVLRSLIDQKMVLLLAQRNNLKVTDAQLDKAVNGIAARNNLSPDQLKIEVAKQGLTYEQFRKQIHDQMLIQETEMHAIGPTLVVTPVEIKQFMQQHAGGDSLYHVQDILFPATQDQMTAVQNKATAVIAQLKNSSDTSAITQSNGQINDLDWRGANELPELFSAKVVTMKVGDVVGPIAAPNGVHLIKLIGIKRGNKTLTELQARNILLEKKLQDNLQPWLDKLYKTAYVKIIE